MNIYKKHHLMKSLFRGTVLLMLALCFLAYQIGWQRGASYTSQVVSDELLEVCEARIEQAENSCVD